MWIFHQNYFPLKNVFVAKWKISEKMVFNLLLGKLTQQLPLCLLGKSLLISALQLSLGTVKARVCVTTLEIGYEVCKRVSKKAQPLSAFQVGSWHIKTFLLQFSCNRALERILFFLWKILRFYFSSSSKTGYFPNYWCFSRKFHFPEYKFQIADHEIWPKQARFLFSAYAFTTLCIFKFMTIIFF